MYTEYCVANWSNNENMNSKLLIEREILFNILRKIQIVFTKKAKTDTSFRFLNDFIEKNQIVMISFSFLPA